MRSFAGCGDSGQLFGRCCLRGKMNSRIVILTEGGISQGFGHITRCTALHHAFMSRGLDPVLLVNGDDTVVDLLLGTRYVMLDWHSDLCSLFEHINKEVLVVIDSYLAESELYRKIKNTALGIICLDDDVRIDCPEGIVVNGSIYAENLQYPGTNNVTYLVGPQYISLRKEFRQVSEKQTKDNIENIAVAFGGSDCRDSTPDILRLLVRKYPSIKKSVVVGKAFKNGLEIEKEKDDKTEMIYYPDAQEVVEFMLDADVAISSGGQFLYEFARVGVPVIIVAAADNQFHESLFAQKIGFAECVGLKFDDQLAERVLSVLGDWAEPTVRLEKSNIAKKTIDGRGADRIADFVVNLFKKEGLAK